MFFKTLQLGAIVPMDFLKLQNQMMVWCEASDTICFATLA